MKESGTVGFSCTSSCTISPSSSHFNAIIFVLFAIRCRLTSESMTQIRTIARHRVESVPFPRTLALPLYVLAELAVGHRAFVVLNASTSQKVSYDTVGRV